MRRKIRQGQNRSMSFRCIVTPHRTKDVAASTASITKDPSAILITLAWKIRSGFAFPCLHQPGPACSTTHLMSPEKPILCRAHRNCISV